MNSTCAGSLYCKPSSVLMLFSTIFLVLVSYLWQERLSALGSSILSNDINSATSANIIDTGYARYLGNLSYPNTVAYLGIPYAEPPVGERRFRAPLPLNKTRVTRENEGKVVNATQYPDFCIQGTIGQGDAGGAGSEDCLNVNIYTPVGAKRGSNLPVLVYIHGGGYVFGNPRNWPFDHWIHQSPNVVIVSVYYRLSSFGFLAVPELRDSANGDLNAGFLDQIQALKWVKENIASFGGDPTKVTINGESAGGSSVELHLVAKEGEKLFSGAIAQSVYRTPLPTPEQRKALFSFYASQAGCGTGPVPQQLTCLRSASISALARAQDAAFDTAKFNSSGYFQFTPVVDGKVITDLPTKSIVRGEFADVPLIVGATTNETQSGGSDISVAMKKFFPSIKEEDVSELIAAYPLDDFASSPSLQLQTLTGDSQLRCARSIMASKFGKQAFTYRYNQPTPGANQVFHAAENYVLFLGTSTGFNGTTTFNALTPSESAFAEEIIAYWLSFVRSGDPNRFKLKRSPIWAPSTSQKSRIVLQAVPGNTTSASGSFLEEESGDETMRCALVASQVEDQQN